MPTVTTTRLAFAWLEITGECSLFCSHCYAGSGPRGTAGAMTGDHWRRLITELADLGVRDVQFIGGEPTLHPEFTALVEHALDTHSAMRVEVFTHLAYDIADAGLWPIFEHERVRVATSYYSDDAAEHDAITRRKGSWERTTRSIAECTARPGVELRVGVINLADTQRSQPAVGSLIDLGMPAVRIGTDDVRGIGRGTDLVTAADSTPARTDCAQLCGQCGNGRVAVFPDGSVGPCIMARTPEMRMGNVLDTTLAAVLDSPERAGILDTLAREFEGRDLRPHSKPVCEPTCAPSQWCAPLNETAGCGPDNCGPNNPPCWPDVPPKAEHECGPQQCGPGGWCGPNSAHNACDPTDQCGPNTSCLPFFATADGACFPDAACRPDGGCHPYTHDDPPRADARCYPDHSCGPNYICGPINCKP